MTGEELREVMRRFPAPVAVVTAALDAERFGLTVGSLVSLSLRPPLVGISIGKDSSSHAPPPPSPPPPLSGISSARTPPPREPTRRAGGWAASLLGGEQVHVAQHFAR